MLKKIFITYIASTVLLGVLFYLTNLFPPHKILKKSSECIDGMNSVQVVDMDRPYNTLFVLDTHNKVYEIDPYRKKLLKTYQLNNVQNLQGLSVNDGKRYPILYVSDENSVYRVNMNRYQNQTQIVPEKILTGLKNPKDIYVYNEYKYTPSAMKRVETLAVLEGDIGKVNIYDVATKKIIESKDAKFHIQERSKNKTSIEMQNIPYYVRGWDNDLGIKTRHFFNHITLRLHNNTFSTKLGKITRTRLGNYLIPDQENNYLWVYDTFDLYDWDFIRLDKTPYMVFTYPKIEPSVVNSDALLKGKENFIAYIQYTDGKGLVCADISNSFYGNVKDLIDSLFKFLATPFYFIVLMTVGKVG